jgi:hypothetical protein
MNPPTKNPAKPNTRRIKMLVRRALRLHDRISELSDKRRTAVALALQNGLAMNQVIEIDGEQWMIIEPVGRFVYFGRHELKKVPKAERKHRDEVVPAAEVAA